MGVAVCGFADGAQDMAVERSQAAAALQVQVVQGPVGHQAKRHDDRTAAVSPGVQAWRRHTAQGAVGDGPDPIDERMVCAALCAWGGGLCGCRGGCGGCGRCGRYRGLGVVWRVGSRFWIRLRFGPGFGFGCELFCSGQLRLWGADRFGGDRSGCVGRLHRCGRRRIGGRSGWFGRYPALWLRGGRYLRRGPVRSRTGGGVSGGGRFWAGLRRCEQAQIERVGLRLGMVDVLQGLPPQSDKEKERRTVQ